MDPFKNIKKIILASGSPRRHELVAHLGLPFEVIHADADENCGPGAPDEVAKIIARAKMAGALKVCKPEPGEIIITADTSVWVSGTMFGKPRDEADAASMLKAISGRSHQVITGVALAWKNSSSGRVNTKTFAEVTDVFVDRLTKTEIEEYISTGDPMDKAGAYGIQGDFSKHISRIEGDYFNVVGLPVAAIYRELKRRDKNDT